MKSYGLGANPKDVCFPWSQVIEDTWILALVLEFR